MNRKIKYLEVYSQHGNDINKLSFAVSDNRIFVTEKDGAIRVVENDQLLESPLATFRTPNVFDGGLLGIATHPNFSDNNFLYVFLTYEENLEPEVNNYPEFKFIPLYKDLKKSNNKFIRLFKSFLIPFRIKSHLLDVDVLYQHQLLGVWIPLILKIQLKI